jgi:hypothetical protein
MSRRRLPARTWWAQTSAPTKAALLLLIVHLAVRAWLILPGDYWQDDFVFLRRARGEELSWSFLVHAHNGHVIPVPFLLTWFGAQTDSYLPAALSLLLLQALASVALWLMLRRVVGSTRPMLVALSVALFTPLMFSTVTWWAAGAMMLGLQLAMALAGHAHVMFQRTGRVRWLVAATLSLLLGFAFWEKAVLIPAFLLLLTLLISGSPRATLYSVRRLWPAWIAYAVVTLAYLVAYLQVTAVGDARVRSIHGVASLARHQTMDVFARGLIGGPWTGAAGPAWQSASVFGLVVLVQLLILFVVLAHRVSGRRGTG